MVVYKNYTRKITNKNKNKKTTPPDAQSDEGVHTILSSIDENFGYIKDTLGESIGLTQIEYGIFNGKINAGLTYIDSIVDKKLIGQYILTPLLSGDIESDIDPDNILLLIQKRFVSVPKITNTSKMEDVTTGLLNGDTVLFLNDASTAIIIGSGKFAKRSIDKPENEAAVLGSQESFTDDLNTNISLIIKRLPVPSLKVEEYMVGKLSKTKVKLIWLDGIANTKIIEEARTRIKRVNIDNVDGVGMLAELISDTPISIFPKYRQTERPDMTVRNIANGRFAIICDNSPFALIAPSVFADNFRTMDDYQEIPVSSSYLRLIRYVAFFISVLISPLYLSFVTYNHTIVPPDLAFNIAAGREGVPFPTVVEMLLMSIAMTVIREAGLRMPGAVGYFIGTLAAVLIGQSIVTAGYVSASLIIVIAVSTISSFAISTTTYIYTSRMLNYFFILCAGFLGMFGLINGMIIVLWHLVSLRSFGVPYLYPIVPYEFESLKDTFVRSPFRFLKKRPRIVSPFNRMRAGTKGTESKQQGKKKE